MSEEIVVVRNTLTDEVGEIRRRLFESPVFNPDGLLVECEDNRSGCVDCGTASTPDETPSDEEPTIVGYLEAPDNEEED